MKFANMEKNEVIILKDRGFIQVKGSEAKDFLQNIVTNDLEKVTNETTIFSSILTPQGKYLYDFFVIKLDNNYLIECEKSSSEEIIKLLNFYKLRTKVDFVEVEKENEILAVGFFHPSSQDHFFDFSTDTFVECARFVLVISEEEISSNLLCDRRGALCFSSPSNIENRGSNNAEIIDATVTFEVGILGIDKGFLNVFGDFVDLTDVSPFFSLLLSVWNGVNLADNLAVSVFNNGDGGGLVVLQLTDTGDLISVIPEHD